MADATYELGTDVNGPFIRCLRCNATSYHRGDIANLYCARCPQFHEDGLIAEQSGGVQVGPAAEPTPPTSSGIAPV